MEAREANGARGQGAHLSSPELGDDLSNDNVHHRVPLGGGLHLLAGASVDWS
jgi:hypothetical protein